MDKTNLNTTFGKIDTDELNQELKDNEQNIFGKTKEVTAT